MLATDAGILRSLFAGFADAGTRDRVNGGGVALDALDAQRVLALAGHHRLSALLGATNSGGAPSALAERFRHAHMVTLGRNILLGHALRECVAGFRARGIEVIVLKGLAYEQTLYPRPGMRQTGDLDLLVEPRFRDAAFAALLDLRFAPVAAAPGFDEADYHEVEWRRGEIYVDLHFALAPFQRCAVDYDAVWAHKRPLPLDDLSAWQLSAPHAAVFHALHMAIHHFDVPAIYLADLALLVPDEQSRAAGEAVARAWRCLRPWRTSLALTASFIPGWALSTTAAAGGGAVAARVAASFGTVAPLPRVEQLRRKIEHFDNGADALRYVLVQGRRAIREQAIRQFSRRSPEQRLGLPKRD